MPLYVQKLTATAVIPTRAHASDAGLDLYADIPADLHLLPSDFIAIPTGIAIALDPWHCGQIWPRSGLALKFGLDVLAGLIDPGYRGEIKVILVNHGHDRYTIKAGDKIAQLVVVPIAWPEVIPVDALPHGERGANGFGSSDKPPANFVGLDAIQ